MSGKMPKCSRRGEPDFKGLGIELYTPKYLRRNWGIWPLLFLQVTEVFCVFYVMYHRLMVSTIDVQLTDQRFEMPSVPRFFDLRNPRNLKLWKMTKWEPAIHLDNRYRLMRGEPMADADCRETSEIGEDTTAGDFSKFKDLFD